MPESVAQHSGIDVAAALLSLVSLGGTIHSEDEGHYQSQVQHFLVPSCAALHPERGCPPRSRPAAEPNRPAAPTTPRPRDAHDSGVIQRRSSTTRDGGAVRSSGSALSPADATTSSDDDVSAAAAATAFGSALLVPVQLPQQRRTIQAWFCGAPSAALRRASAARHSPL